MPTEQAQKTREERLEDVREAISNIGLSVSYEVGERSCYDAEDIVGILQNDCALTDREVAYLSEYVSSDIDGEFSDFGDKVRDLLACAVDELEGEPEEEDEEEDDQDEGEDVEEGQTVEEQLTAENDTLKARVAELERMNAAFKSGLLVTAHDEEQ